MNATMKTAAELKAEMMAKSGTVASLGNLAEQHAAAYAACFAAHEAAKADEDKADRAFAAEQSDANAVALTRVQHRVRQCARSLSQATEVAEKARGLHASANAELERTRGELARQRRIDELEAIVARENFDARAAALSKRALASVEALCGDLDALNSLAAERAIAAAELEKLKPGSGPRVDGVRTLLWLIGKFAADGRAMSDHDLAAFMPAPAKDWASGFIAKVTAILARPLASPGQAANFAQLVEAIRANDNYSEAHLALHKARQPQPIPAESPQAAVVRYGRDTLTRPGGRHT